MAIFGAGSSWDGGEEQKQDFFEDENFVIGWSYEDARDVYLASAALKAGDIIYLKSNAPGQRKIKVKGIGVVTKSIIEGVWDDILVNRGIVNISPVIEVRWVITDEFHIEIPDAEGKFTAVRASTFYEEYLPFVQSAIINRLFSNT
jgi:hypothetical protein